MENDSEFYQKLFKAFNDKLEWYNSKSLPELLSDYRNLHSLSESFFTTLVDKGILIDDPYKLDKKVTDIKPIENGSLTSSERNKILGVRFSDYILTLTSICDYLPFNTSSLTVDKVKKLKDFNKSFIWNAVTPSSADDNTREMATCLAPLFQSSDVMLSNLITSSVDSLGKALVKINKTLDEYSVFQRESYKVLFRQNVLQNPAFSYEKCTSKDEMMKQIEHVVKSTGIKIPIYVELIKEIIEESIGEHKTEAQNQVLAKLAVNANEKSKKKEKINTKDILLDAVQTFTPISNHIFSVCQKFSENSQILQEASLSGWGRFLKKIKIALGIKEKPIIYKITVIEPLTQSKKAENIDFNAFVAKMDKRARYFAAMGTKGHAINTKLKQSSESTIFETLTKVLAEWQKYTLLLNGFDEFFKAKVPNNERSKIKGIKMELTGIKNVLVKTTQKKSEYLSLVEEEKQFEKLGIANEI